MVKEGVSSGGSNQIPSSSAFSCQKWPALLEGMSCFHLSLSSVLFAVIYPLSTATAMLPTFPPK